MTAEVLERTLAMHAGVALEHYLEEVQILGSQLSLALGLVSASDALLALAARSPDQSPHRSDEPYRRALAGIHARLSLTRRSLLDGETGPSGPASAYAGAAELALAKDDLTCSVGS